MLPFPLLFFSFFLSTIISFDFRYKSKHTLFFFFFYSCPFTNSYLCFLSVCVYIYFFKIAVFFFYVCVCVCVCVSTTFLYVSRLLFIIVDKNVALRYRGVAVV